MSWILVIIGALLVFDSYGRDWRAVIGALSIILGAVVFCLQRGLIRGLL